MAGNGELGAHGIFTTPNLMGAVALVPWYPPYRCSVRCRVTIVVSDESIKNGLMFTLAKCAIVSGVLPARNADSIKRFASEVLTVTAVALLL